MNILPSWDSAVCPGCKTPVMHGDRFCSVCGRAMPYAGMKEYLLRPERDALCSLQENTSIALEEPPEPLHALRFSLQNLTIPLYPAKMNFFYVPETGHFYAVYERGDSRRQSELVRSWDSVEKAELARIMLTLGEHDEYFHICSLPADGSPDWKPMCHASLNADAEPTLPEIPDPPSTYEEAQAREEAALKELRDIDWERGGYRLPVSGAIYLGNRHYYVPATRRFYKVEQSGDYYHGYESEISESSKSRLYDYILRNLKSDALLGSNSRDVLGQVMELCAADRLASRLPEAPEDDPTENRYGKRLTRLDGLKPTGAQEPPAREFRFDTPSPGKTRIPVELRYWEVQPTHISLSTFSFDGEALTFTREDQVDGPNLALRRDANLGPYTERRVLTEERGEWLNEMCITALIQCIFFATKRDHGSDRKANDLYGRVLTFGDDDCRRRVDLSDGFWDKAYRELFGRMKSTLAEQRTADEL